MDEKIKEYFYTIIDIYRDAVKIKAGPISPSCGLLLFIFAYALSKSREKITVVDVGAGVGVSTAFLAAGTDGRVYAIEKNKNFCEKLQENIASLKLDKKVEIICGDFVDYVDSISDADFVFIDLGHKIDYDLINSAMKILKNNGILLMHDAILHVTRVIDVLSFLRSKDYVYSIIPVDTGILAVSKSSENFMPTMQELFRLAPKLGPTPVSFNTAKLIFILSKITCKPGTIFFDIGAGYGVSTFSMCLAVKNSHCKVYAVEKNEDYAKHLMMIRRKLGLEETLDILVMDAKEIDVRKFVSFAFIDAKKDEYLEYLKRLEKHLRSGTIIGAHNTISHAYLMKDFLEYVYEHFYSITIMTDEAGVTISLNP